MTLDSRLEAAAHDTRDRMSGLAPPLVRRGRRWLVATVGVAAAVAVVFAVVVWRGSGPFDGPVGEEPLTDLVGEDVYLGPGETLLSEEPVVVQGASGVEARFDPVGLGEEATLGPLADVGQLVAQIEATTASAVLGDVFRITVIGVTEDGSTAALVYTEVLDPEGSLLRMRCVRIDGGGSCSGQPVGELASEPGGLPGPGRQTPGPTYSVGGPSKLSWEPLPEGTSVVLFTSNELSRWQRPVAGVAVFDTDLRDGDEFVLTALDADGDTIVRQSATARN